MSFGSSANEPFLHQFYCHAKMCYARTWYLEHNRIIPRHALYVDLHTGRPCYPVKVSVDGIREIYTNTRFQLN